MYHSRFSKIALFCVTTIILNACASRPHNNVLIFGTDTKFALDISSEATQGNYPEVTLGYKRREAVYLPLSRNGYECIVDKKTKKQNCSMRTTDDKYMGTAEGTDLTKSNKGNDTYSVFASFGAKFDAGVNSSGGLAQFFATGVAAQRLGQNPHVEKALSLRSGEAEVAVAEKNEAQALAELASLEKSYIDAVGKEKFEELKKNDEKIKTIRKINVQNILKCADLKNENGKWKSLIEYTQKDDSLSTALKTYSKRLEQNKTDSHWTKRLNTKNKIINSMLESVKQSCP